MHDVSLEEEVEDEEKEEEERYKLITKSNTLLRGVREGG